MNSYLHDTHSHIDLSEDVGLLVTEIEKRQIYTIAVTNLPPLYLSLKSKVNSKYIRPALGFHPELIQEYSKYIPQMWELLPNSKYIGEVGLDKKVGKYSYTEQLKFFEELITRCNSYSDKILSIHSRGSEKDVISIIGKNFKNNFILHWYSGSLNNLKDALDIGAYFSVNYAMTNSINGSKIIQNIPINKMLLESDYPFINLNTYEKFSTINIEKIISRLSEIKQIEYSKLNLILSENFKTILLNSNQ